MTDPSRAAAPFAVWAYGVLGLVPFLVPPLAGALWPGWNGVAGQVAAIYGALILSFLGGARWGLAVARPQPGTLVVSLAMLPTLAGFALLLLPASQRPLQLAGLAVLLGIHLLWDVRSSGLPRWYPSLRSVLTGGAMLGLLAAAALAAGE